MNKNVISDPEFGYLRLEPIPTQQEVEEFYAKEFYDANASYFNNSALELQLEQKEFFDTRWEAINEVLKTFFNNETNKSVFDIGFGFAQALLFLKEKGYQVAGLEPSIEGVEYAQKNGIQEAHHSGIENFKCVGDKRFDIVLLINVLEHLRQPAETIKNIKNDLITKNGLLVIDVPNDFNLFQEIADKEYDLNKWWVVSPNHINYFSNSSLSKLLNDCGFEIVDYEAAFPLDMFLLFGDQYIGNPKLGRECHNKRVHFEKMFSKWGKQKELKAFYKSLADLNLGRSITIYATPKK